MAIAAFLFASTTLLTLSSAFEVHPVYTSCHHDSGVSNWKRAQSYRIKSWLKSTVILPSTKMTRNQLLGHFERDRGGNLNLKALTGSGLTWMRYGSSNTDGWLYGAFQLDDVFYEEDLINAAFVYVDMRSAFVGNFTGKKMKAARASKVTKFRCSNGMLELGFSNRGSNASTYAFDSPTDNFVSSVPTLMDPLDMNNVYLAKSGVGGTDGGQGLFAKRALPPDEVLAVYSGVWIYHTGPDSSDSEWRSLNRTVQEDAHKNLISFNSTHSINVPPAISKEYRASLGHKLNHKFSETNAAFDYITSPRFGLTRCVRTTRSVAKGEELFINYGYSVNGWLPEWYAKLYRETYGVGASTCSRN